MRRRGFTLVELVSSLFVSSVVIVALASSIGLASRALPDGSRPTQTAVSVQRALDLIANDARFATTLTIVNEGEISLETPDRDGDGVSDIITYRWAGTEGDPLTREYKSLGEAPVITSADDVGFEWASMFATVEPSHRCLMATIRVGTIEMSIAQRCFNVEVP